MIIYKLGCIWGKGAPDFYEMIKSKSISLSHTHDCKPKKDSVILITNGHTIKAITILLEDCICTLMWMVFGLKMMVCGRR